MTGEYLKLDPKDIFTVTKEGYVLLGEHGMNLQELKTLQEEIKYLEKTRVWQILTTTIAERAKEIMFEKAENFEDMRTGKAILYAVDLQQKIIKQLKGVIPREQTPAPKFGEKKKL